MDLTEQAIEMARREGAKLVGVASVDRFDGAPTGHHPAELLPGASSVLTFGIPLLSRVLEWPELIHGSPLIPEENRLEALGRYFYRRSGYDVVNDRLSQIALTIASHLEDTGYPSLFFPATHGHAAGSRLGTIPGFFSQRHAAVRAGLGEFGLNNVVVTERYGPRIRFNSVITTAPLAPSPLWEAKLCLGAGCGRCVEECGGQAISPLAGVNEGEVWLNPASRTSWALCQAAYDGCMGRCLRVCPVGR